MHVSWMMLRKQGALNKQMLRLGCCLSPLPKFLATCLLLTTEFVFGEQSIRLNTFCLTRCHLNGSGFSEKH